MPFHHPAFDTLTESELSEYRCRGIFLRHKRTGCELFRLAAEDEEKVFAFAFPTPPADSMGIPHIVEHSVLCGSRRYPVKDPFLAMARRSLATFMNAFTYPDKTVYPAASTILADFLNLMSVYADAVFRPLLSEETFLQEAHHLEVDGGLEVKGVVYNEMRGDYSSPDSLAATACYTSLFSPGHPYSFDAGGDPLEIPSLDYGRFKTFWAEHYHPSACKIFLYGDMDTESLLDFIDESVLDGFDARKRPPEVGLQKPFTAPRRVEIPCPVAESADSSSQTIVNWLTVPVTDGTDALALELLAEILLGHDGSPLAKSLRDSELGEDLSPQCGIDTSFRQILFSAGIRGSRRAEAADVEDLVLGRLGRVVAEGIPPDSIETALHSIAFANREIRRGSAAYGFRLFSRSIRGWMHGSHPEATLSFEKPLSALRARLSEDGRYLEGLVERLLVRNPHRSTVSVYPEAGLLERREAERAASLAAKAAALGQAELASIAKRAAELSEAQAKADSPAALSSLPRLSLRDIPSSIDRVPRLLLSAGDFRVSSHPVFTNGIVYLDLAFGLDGLPRGSQPWLPLLTRFVSGAGAAGKPYDVMAELLSREAGGFGAILNSNSPVASSASRSYVIFRLKALSEKFDSALGLALDLICSADYGDEDRVRDLFLELRNDVQSALVPSGNSFALARACAGFSDALAIEELWRGPSQLEFLLGLAADEGERTRGGAGPIGEALSALAGHVFVRDGLRIGLTADEKDVAAALSALEARLGLLPASHSSTTGSPATGARPGTLPQAAYARPGPLEAYSISAQVGFAAAALPGSRVDEPAYAHECVLAHYLGTGPLWQELRVRRGAYGASASPDGLEGVFSFSTYRDPKPFDSLGFFAECLERSASGIAESEAQEATIGAVGRDLKPLLPEEQGFADFRRELYGIDDSLRQAKRDAMLSTRASDIEAAASRLARNHRDSASVLISRAEDVELMRHAYPGVRVVELPF